MKSTFKMNAQGSQISPVWGSPPKSSLPSMRPIAVHPIGQSLALGSFRLPGISFIVVISS